MNISAVILAGGESSRMGRDKAWLEIDGQALITRALNTVRGSGIEEIYISGRSDTDYSGLRYPVLLDRTSSSGPVGGIERALDTTQASLLLVLAVDLPKMTTAFLLKLASRCEPLTGAIPKLNGRLEPLASIYPKRCSFIARDCLIRGRFAARDFADACRREHAARTFSVSQGDIGCFENWNSPVDITTSVPEIRQPRTHASGNRKPNTSECPLAVSSTNSVSCSAGSRWLAPL